MSFRETDRVDGGEVVVGRAEGARGEGRGKGGRVR